MAKRKVERLKEQLHKLELQATDKVRGIPYPVWVHCYGALWPLLRMFTCAYVRMCVILCMCMQYVPKNVLQHTYICLFHCRKKTRKSPLVPQN